MKRIWNLLFKYLEQADTAAAVQTWQPLPVIDLIISNYPSVSVYALWSRLGLRDDFIKVYDVFPS